MILYRIFAMIDKILYKIVGTLLQLVIDIANVDFFSEAGIVENFSRRIYALLGVFMLFKLVLTAIQSFANPEQMSDQNKGMGALLKNTLVCVLLLVMVPSIFTFAKFVQIEAVEMIPAFVLGTNVENIEPDRIGDALAFQTLRSFITVKSGDDFDNIFLDYSGNELPSGAAYIRNFETFDEFITAPNSCGLGNSNTWNLKGVIETTGCGYEYRFGLSTLAGAYLIYMLIGIVLDVATRTIKFGVLEVLAPIPIASYIDNKTREMSFNAWLKMCKDVYLDLFIRLFVLYFTLYCFNMLLSENVATEIRNLLSENIFATLVIIIALFTFIKDAPKFLCDALGIKGDGSLAGMFTWGKRYGGVLGAGLGVVTAAGSNLINSARNIFGAGGGSIGRRLKSALLSPFSVVGGALSAGVHGGFSALQGKSFKEVMDAGHHRAIRARNNRARDQLYGINGLDRLAVRTSQFLGLDSAAGMADEKVKAYDRMLDDTKALKSTYNGLFEKYGTRIDACGNDDSKRMVMQLGSQYGASLRAAGYSDLADRMENGGIVSYSELISLRSVARNSNDTNLHNLANDLSDTSERMKAIQKGLMVASVAGKLRDVSGNPSSFVAELSMGSDRFDEDLSSVFASVHEHIAEDSPMLADAVGGRPNDAEGMYREYLRSFTSFDQRVKRTRNAVRDQIKTTKRSRAEDAVRRRDDNKKS